MLLPPAFPFLFDSGRHLGSERSAGLNWVSDVHVAILPSAADYCRCCWCMASAPSASSGAARSGSSPKQATRCTHIGKHQSNNQWRSVTSLHALQLLKTAADAEVQSNINQDDCHFHRPMIRARIFMRISAQVYAPTFPGYGRSEKPAVTYSAELWRDFLRDFILEVRGLHTSILRLFTQPEQLHQDGRTVAYRYATAL